MPSQGGDSRAAQPSPYGYHPSVPMAAIGAALFVVATLVTLWQFFRYRTWFLWAMIVGVLMECSGFVARAISARNLDEAYPFLIGYLALILAPSFIAAACYMTFGRMVWWVTPVEKRTLWTLWCPPRFLTAIFVLFDLGSFFVQFLGACAVGAAYTGKDLSAEQREDGTENGLAVLKLGLVLQLVCFGIFAVVGARFLVVSRRWAGRASPYNAEKPSWRRLSWMVNLSATLITLRAVYRFLEFTGPRTEPGYLRLHEWTFWVFDALPVLLVFCLFAAAHPGRYLPRELVGLRLNGRRLDQKIDSSPPSYHQASSIPLAHVRG